MRMIVAMSVRAARTTLTRKTKTKTFRRSRKKGDMSPPDNDRQVIQENLIRITDEHKVPIDSICQFMLITLVDDKAGFEFRSGKIYD